MQFQSYRIQPRLLAIHNVGLDCRVVVVEKWSPFWRSQGGLVVPLVRSFWCSHKAGGQAAC